MDINEIKDPTFLKQLNYKEMNTLAKDIRSFIIENVSQTGGHLSSNLGTVELIMTLHRVFDAPLDRFLFDVGHQAYTHKILTGRAKQFRTLRSYQGLSGYLKMSESPYDCFESGHSSTSLSTALGMAVARDQKNEHYHIIDVIGDASIANGVAFEALNSVEQTPSKIIIILKFKKVEMKFNEKLIKLRKAAGLSQEELGNRLNVARQTVSKWELGETTPEMDKLEELSNIFEISIDELVKNDAIPNVITKEINQEKIDSLYKDIGTAKKGIKTYLIIVGVFCLLFIVIPLIIFFVRTVLL